VHPAVAELDDLARLRLAGAYWRRRRLEARLLASELAKVLRGVPPGREQVSTADAAAQWFGG
jgi:hypothetical protein